MKLILCLLLAISSALPAPETGRSGLVSSARSQIGQTVIYDPAYVSLRYPKGDVPLDRGVCCDVIIRALRGVGADLQQLVHEDMAAHFSAYPQLWKLRKPDPNIDHRRVPNLARFFQRQGRQLPVTKLGSDYAAGDFVVCRLSNGLIHIMLVSDRVSEAGIPLVIHNIGRGTQEEDRLFEFKIEGHYRWFRATEKAGK